jgi:RND family efflux transporter MFP subunit
MKDLFATKSIEERLVDESKEQYEASLETERSSKAAIASANANLVAAAAKIRQAEADVAGAEAEVLVAKAEIARTQVLLDYATIKAPFNGEVTHRAFFPGAFVRSAAEGANQQPLLTVQRTDLFRVVVRVPDIAVPYLDKGDPAIVRIDSLPGRTFPATVSRRSRSEDPDTRLMRVEVDLPNPTGVLSDGMYGKVKIVLDRFPKLLSIPATCTFTTKADQSAVFVVRDGRVHLQPLRLGPTNGTNVTVLDGLVGTDLVVLHPNSGVRDAMDVHVRVVEEQPAR